MDAVWVQSLHNLHCPRCDHRLVQRAGRHLHGVLGVPVYVGHVGTLVCPRGHALPDRERLYAYRAERGHAPSAPVSEVGPPAR
ncbi:hypothetical protein [Geodermatophilus sp. SYSU D00815]